MLNSLKAFDKSTLKKTITKVTTVTGDQYVESKNEQGLTESRKVAENGTFKGFVVDPFADLQVGEILEGLILGKYQSVSYFKKTQKTHKKHGYH